MTMILGPANMALSGKGRKNIHEECKPTLLLESYTSARVFQISNLVVRHLLAELN